MDYQLENTVRTSTKSPHPNLYSWFIEELDVTGKKIGPDYKPWGSNLHFNAKNLRVYRGLTLEDGKAKASDGIIGALIPSEGRRHTAVVYSFFGTNRPVDTITLRIYKSEDEREVCALWGSVAYVSEWDFEDVRTPDTVEVQLFLAPSRFEGLAKFIEDGQAKGGITIRHVEGVYAQWSPSIRTDTVKLLGNLEDQEVQIETGADHIPAVLGRIGYFEYRFHKGGRSEEVVTNNDTPGNEEPQTPRPVAAVPDLGPSLAALQAKVARLSIPLWIAAIAAVVSVFIHR
ncbi:hypothetical protein HFO28_13785 [Rhizobium leguminosarum]|uniref:hypothetical protein n=1 Tax=Rhizobium leguminosarum TaxID=384 RepID=UPI001C96387A|nr:hypothetical protein [Rhizobium leguminosarum]MBY5744651.1 hypothetical protein [Rhizobium leguminosarum]